MHYIQPGWIQRLKKGGIHIEWGWCGVRGMHAVVSVYIVHSILGGSGGMLSSNINHVRVLQRPPQPHKICGNWSVTQVIHCMIISQSPFPSESAFVFEALTQNCLLGAADLSALCLQDTKQ